jgi:metal-dependent HD superfamily phosphatase/phosphodiesterase
MSLITYEYIKSNEEIRTYIKQADRTLEELGYTEHSFAHVGIVAENASMILKALDYPERMVELTRIAGYMHDIGNVVNRVNHALSGANMAFRLLDKINMPPEEIAQVISAIGHHDEGTAQPLSPMSAAIIIADKTDVRRSRVRNTDLITFDIHDRVNYAAEKSSLHFNEDKSALIMDLTIDTDISSVMEYFEIFLDRMLLCKRSAMYLGVKFKFIINGLKMM